MLGDYGYKDENDCSNALEMLRGNYEPQLIEENDVDEEFDSFFNNYEKQRKSKATEDTEDTE